MDDQYEERQARARYLLGMLLADVYQNECAAELFSAAIERRPGMAEAHLALGFVVGRDDDHIGMVDLFREAVGLDAAAVRAAVGGEPEELAALKRILYPEPPAPAIAMAQRKSAMPDYVREGGELVESARGHIAAGRDAEAVAALVRVLRLDAEHWYAAHLLALTCLLSQAGGEVAEALADAEAVLREVEPGLAEKIFGL